VVNRIRVWEVGEDWVVFVGSIRVRSRVGFEGRVMIYGVGERGGRRRRMRSFVCGIEGYGSWRRLGTRVHNGRTPLSGIHWDLGECVTGECRCGKYIGIWDQGMSKGVGEGGEKDRGCLC
jgi:hypothetical protein